MSKTLNDLTLHMNKYKDAIILLGPGAIPSFKQERVSLEDRHLYFTKKFQRTEPDKFLDFFLENFYQNPNEISLSYAQDSALNLKYLGIVSQIIDLNGDGLMNVKAVVENIIELHGSMTKFTCDKLGCRRKYNYDEIIENDTYKTKTCSCGAYIKPDVLLSGNTYDQNRFDLVKHLIATTHTLITVGIDYSEDPILNLIQEYDVIRKVDPSEKRYLVAIFNKDLGFDVNDIAFHDFISERDPAEALDIICASLK